MPEPLDSRYGKMSTIVAGAVVAPACRARSRAVRISPCAARNASRSRSGQAEEADELLGEDVVLADVEPGLAAHLVLVVARPRDVAEVAVGDEAQLVVVVEDRRARARVTPKFLSSRSPGKMLVSGEVADRLAVVEHRLARGPLVALADEEVERRHAPLDVEVADQDASPVDADRARRLGERAPRAAPARSGRASKTRCSNSCASTSRPARSCWNTSSYFCITSWRVHVLRRRELVADHLEDDVERGQGEDDHHHARVAARRARSGRRVCGEVAEELAVPLGLAVLVAAERGVQLARRASAAGVAQERHQLAPGVRARRGSRSA